MSANADNDDPEVQDIISCVDLFYEKGKSGSSFPSAQGKISGATPTEG